MFTVRCHSQQKEYIALYYSSLRKLLGEGSTAMAMTYA